MSSLSAPFTLFVAFALQSCTALHVVDTPQDALSVEKEGFPMPPQHSPPNMDQGQAFIEGFLGGGQWPKHGSAHRPPIPLSGDAVSPPSSLWRVVRISGIFIFIAAVLIACLLRMFPRNCTESLADSEKALNQSTRVRFNTSQSHVHALCYAAVWRHLSWQYMVAHLCRISIPVVFVFVICHMRNRIAKTFLQTIELTDKERVALSNGTFEFGVAIAMLYIILFSMMQFTSHLCDESESGLRHLLHVSGVSRRIYMMATAGVDGFLIVMMQVLLLIVVATDWLQVRLILWTSPLLLCAVVLLMDLSALVTAYLVHFIAPSTRMANICIQMIIAIVTLAAIGTIVVRPVPDAGEVYWSSLALPILPAFRALFQLVVGCSRGRCLTLGDVKDAMTNGEYIGAWGMMYGRGDAEEVNASITPPAALLSFAVSACVQVVLMWACVALLDLRRYPNLNNYSSSVQQKKDNSSSSLLEVRGLKHQYGWLQGMIPSEKSATLKGIDFSIAPGAVLGLLGPNGAGKTTTIRCIVGEESPTEGSVSVGSTNDSSYIGLCPQETVVHESLTVEKNLLFFAYIRGCGGPGSEHILDKFLTATCLKDKRHCLPNALSGGMRRRLAVACSLIGSPAVVVLDEPTTGLDPLSRRGIWSTINDLKLGGGCCLMTTHMLEEAEALCSKLVIIKKGLVVASGSVQQLKEEWGTGYTLTIESTLGKQDTARMFVASRVPKECSAPIKDTGAGQMTFRLNIEEEELGHLIIAISQNKDESGIRHWGLSQASLEDTYVNIIDKEDTYVNIIDKDSLESETKPASQPEAHKA